MEIKLSNGEYEEFTVGDSFEIYVTFWGVYWVVLVNSTGRHRIDFYLHEPAARKRISEFYGQMGLQAPEIKITESDLNGGKNNG